LISLFLGFVMACLMFSKYHAILVILFVLASNLSLLKNKYAWIAVGVSLVCYIPHFYWLFENDFVSIEYHISERPNQPYTFTGFTLGYMLNLAVNFGLLFPWFYYALFTAKPKDSFTRALSYLSMGVIVFFFFSTFHRRSQAQWVIVICIPMAILGYQLLLSNLRAKKWMFSLSLVSAVLLLYARLWLVYQPLLPKIYESHGNKQWVSELKEIVEDTPVVFENSYRTSSMYHFYSGDPSFSLNNIYYRRNQYSINDSEARLQNKRIAYVSYYATKGDFYFQKFNGDTVYGKYIDPFRSYRKLWAYLPKKKVLNNSDKQQLNLYNPYDKAIQLKNLSFRISYLNDYKQLKDVKVLNLRAENDTITQLKAKDTTAFWFKLPKTDMENPHFVKFSISEFNLPTGINSPSIPLE